MAKKNVQPVESDVEIIAPDVEESKSKKNAKSVKVDKNDKSNKTEKVENSKKNKNNKQKKERKSLKKKTQEVWSELKKVSKPSFGKVCKNTCVVIAVVAICTVLLWGVDKLFSLVNGLLLP